MKTKPAARRYLKLFLSDDERDALRRAAAAQNLNQQQYLRTALSLANQLTTGGHRLSSQAGLPFDERVSKDELRKMPPVNSVVN